MTPEQEERLVASFERMAEAYDFMAGTLEAIAHTVALHHSKMFPAKTLAADATISRILTDEERLRQEQGQSGESLKDWTTLDEEEEIGPREKAWLEKHPEDAAGRKKANKV